MNKDNLRAISVNSLASISSTVVVPTDGYFTAEVPINSLTPNSPGHVVLVPESWLRPRP